MLLWLTPKCAEIFLYGTNACPDGTPLLAGRVSASRTRAASASGGHWTGG